MFVHIDPNSRLGKVILVFGIPLFVAFLYFQVREWTDAYQSLSWPKVPGMVAASAIEWERSSHGPRSTARIQFRYEVGGSEFENKKVSFGLFRGLMTPNYAQKRAARFPPGAAVMVAYCPDDPERSCLEPGGFGWEDGFMFAVSIGGIVLGLQQLWLAYRWLMRRIFHAGLAQPANVFEPN